MTGEIEPQTPGVAAPVETSAELAPSELGELSLGGEGGSIAPYHPLALDPEGTGFWSWVDRTVNRVTAWLNPILVKEARQSLKSKQFLFTFFALLTTSCGWTILGIVFNAPDVYYVPSGQNMMVGYVLILTVSMLGFIPLVAFRSLAAELDEGTYEMLAITRLSAWRIVSGKMNSAILQMMIYFAAIVPCLAFCYLLRGVGIYSIALTIAIVLVTAMVLTSLGLVLSTLAKGRTLQTFLLVGLVAFIVFVEIYICAIIFSEILDQRSGGTLFGYLCGFTVAGSFVVLFLAAAAARIAPLTENRSTRLRAICFAQQIIWIVAMTYSAWSFEEMEILNVAMMMAGIYWLAVGVFMCGESNELSPRVRRDLPSTFATRALFSWWMPGPGTGFMYVISTAMAGMLVMGFAGEFGARMGVDSRIQTHPINFASMTSGLLIGYLGLIRLASMPLLSRFGPSFVVPIIVTILLLFLGVVVPAIIDVAIQGEVPDNYSPLHASNCFWTLIEAFDSGLDWEIATLIFAAGLIILGFNLILLFREFRRRKIAVPRRVVQDKEADLEPS